jgi:hypothetical protein
MSNITKEESKTKKNKSKLEVVMEYILVILVVGGILFFKIAVPLLSSN